MNKVYCTRCIYDTTLPAISFDQEGVCNYCHMIDGLQDEYQTGTPAGEEKFGRILEDIRREGHGKQFDCVIGVSGGTDSSFLVMKAVREWGLRPLAVHYDNTWNSAIATENIRKVLTELGVPLHTHVVDNREADDLFRAFFLAGVPELDGPTDIAAPEVMYRACAKHKIRFVLEGHSFRTEGVSPLGNMYIDGRYVKSVHRRYGRMPLRTFPNMTLLSFLKWITLYRIQKVRPLWYISYDKAKAREVLAREFDWQYYGGHHLENRLTAFHHSYYNPKKCGVDQRNNSLSAAVRSGLMSREEALAEYAEPPYMEPELLEYFLKRLDISNEVFERTMAEPPRSYKDFATYKKHFEMLRPFFYMMYKKGRVPKSFYIKYTSAQEM